VHSRGIVGNGQGMSQWMVVLVTGFGAFDFDAGDGNFVGAFLSGPSGLASRS